MITIAVTKFLPYFYGESLTRGPKEKKESCYSRPFDAINLSREQHNGNKWYATA